MGALWLVVLLVAADPAPPVAPAAPTLALPAAAEAPVPLEVGVTLTPADGVAHVEEGRPLEVTLGEPLVLTLSAKAPRDAVLFPPLTPAVGTFEIGRSLEGSEKAVGDMKERTWRWQVLPVRLGVEKVPPIELPYRLADGREGSVSTPLLRVMVKGHLENEQDPALGAAPPPVDVIATDWALVWALSIGGAIVFAALATWLVLLALRQRFEALRPPAPPRPANEVAFERLEKIDQASASELDGATRLAATVDALREYLGGRYRIDALEMTTRELEAALPGLDLKTVRPAEIKALCDEADLVKFARIMPADSDARQASPVVRRIVTETWEAPEEEAPEVERREAASVRQRLYAGLVDGIMAGSLGLLFGMFLWLGGHLELGFLAIVAVGVLLVFRDAFGRSPGKVMLRLEVVMRDDEQSPADALLRVRRNVLLLLWPLTAPLEALVLRQHPLGLRIGDMWADTEVVRSLEVARPLVRQVEART